MPESSEFNRFWTPVFTGVTLLGLVRDHHPCYQESTMGARTRILRPFPPGAHAIRGWDGPRGNVIAASAACPGGGAAGDFLEEVGGQFFSAGSQLRPHL